MSGLSFFTIGLDSRDESCIRVGWKYSLTDSLVSFALTKVTGLAYRMELGTGFNQITFSLLSLIDKGHQKEPI